MTSKTSAFPSIRTRLLRTLAANREFKVHFPGIFMGLTGRRGGRRDVTLEFDDGAWCRDARGEVAMPALGVLLDSTLGAVTRLLAGRKRRHATVHIEAQFTGAATKGHLKARSHFMGFSTGSALEQGMSRATITAGRTPVAHAAGAFVILDLPEGAPQTPPSWTRGAGPGKGATFDVRASVIHSGRSLAVVRTEIVSDSGRRGAPSHEPARSA